MIRAILDKCGRLEAHLHFIIQIMPHLFLSSEPVCAAVTCKFPHGEIGKVLCTIFNVGFYSIAYFFLHCSIATYTYVKDANSSPTLI